VPKDKIIIENKSTNSEENLRFSIKVLKDKGIHLNKVILVHKPYMERRQYATWLKLFPEIKAVITSPEISFEKYITEAGILKEENCIQQEALLFLKRFLMKSGRHMKS